MTTGKPAPARAQAAPRGEPAKFVTGSTMRHVVVMTATGSIGLVAVFIVDALNLFYISLLGQQELAAAIGYAGTLLFFRLGAPDSEKLEVYTNPEFDAQDLRELPDYHVAARLLNRGHPAKPFVFKAMSPETLGVDPYSTMKAEALNTLRETYTMTREEVESRLCQRRSRVMCEEESQAHA